MYLFIGNSPLSLPTASNASAFVSIGAADGDSTPLDSTNNVTNSPPESTNNVTNTIKDINPQNKFNLFLNKNPYIHSTSPESPTKNQESGTKNQKSLTLSEESSTNSDKSFIVNIQEPSIQPLLLVETSTPTDKEDSFFDDEEEFGTDVKDKAPPTPLSTTSITSTPLIVIPITTASVIASLKDDSFFDDEESVDLNTSIKLDKSDTDIPDSDKPDMDKLDMDNLDMYKLNTDKQDTDKLDNPKKSLLVLNDHEDKDVSFIDDESSVEFGTSIDDINVSIKKESKIAKSLNVVDKKEDSFFDDEDSIDVSTDNKNEKNTENEKVEKLKKFEKNLSKDSDDSFVWEGETILDEDENVIAVETGNKVVVKDDNDNNEKKMVKNETHSRFDSVHDNDDAASITVPSKDDKLPLNVSTLLETLPLKADTLPVENFINDDKSDKNKPDTDDSDTGKLDTDKLVTDKFNTNKSDIDKPASFCSPSKKDLYILSLSKNNLNNSSHRESRDLTPMPSTPIPNPHLASNGSKEIKYLNPKPSTRNSLESHTPSPNPGALNPHLSNDSRDLTPNPSIPGTPKRNPLESKDTSTTATKLSIRCV